jgi:hypothetical protein
MLTFLCDRPSWTETKHTPAGEAGSTKRSVNAGRRSAGAHVADRRAHTALEKLEHLAFTKGGDDPCSSLTSVVVLTTQH